MADVADPARRATGFHHHQVRFLRREQFLDLMAFGFDGGEAIFAGSGFVEAANGLEFAKIHGKD